MSKGIRGQYADHPEGAEGYYKAHGATYRSPHEHAVRRLLRDDCWEIAKKPPTTRGGGGDGDDDDGDDSGADSGDRILDLACGSGEITRALLEIGIPVESIDATDPFTQRAFEERCGFPCWSYSFQDIANGTSQIVLKYNKLFLSYLWWICEHVDMIRGSLRVSFDLSVAYSRRRPHQHHGVKLLVFISFLLGVLEDKTYDLVVCSFALHLLDESFLPTVCAELARRASRLLIFTPHKRPQLREDWGWQLVTEKVIADGRERVRGRMYTSMIYETSPAQ